MDASLVVLVVLATIAAFTLSASAGLGGSFILIPILALLLGTKQGIALAAPSPVSRSPQLSSPFRT